MAKAFVSLDELIICSMSYSKSMLERREGQLAVCSDVHNLKPSSGPALSWWTTLAKTAWCVTGRNNDKESKPKHAKTVTGAKIIAEALQELGVERVYFFPGSSSCRRPELGG